MQIGLKSAVEPHNLYKKQEARLKNPASIQIGGQIEERVAPENRMLIQQLRARTEEILLLHEPLQIIKSMLERQL